MIKLKYDQLSSVRPLLAERIEEACIFPRVTLEYAESILMMNVVSNVFSVFVDKHPDPSSLLIVSTGRSSVLNETTCVINILHVSKAVRDESPRLAISLKDEMLATAEAHAISVGADLLQAASWVYRGCTDISPILEKAGFEPQSREFVKILNPQNK